MQTFKKIAVMMTLVLPATALAHGGVEHVMGTVKALTATSLTVETKEKNEVKVIVDDKTRFEKAGAQSTAKELQVGARVVVDTKKKEGATEPLAVVVKFGSEHHHAEQAQSGGQTVALAVTEQGFTPERVKVKKSEPVTLVITRKTDKTCATAINIPDYGIQRELPLNQAVTVNFSPKKTGEIKYVCGMGMPGGVIVVE